MVADNAQIVISSPQTVEILPKGVDKGITLQRVIAKNNFEIDEVVVFGDSGNDATMVGEFPVSMAMENCRKNTCEAALFKIGKNDTDTIARVIKRLVMRKSCRERLDHS